MYNNREYESTNITSATTTVVFTGKGVLQAITLGTTAAGAITIVDGSQTRGTLKASIVEGTYWYNMRMSSGLSIITAGASDLVVTWAKP